VSGRRWYRPLLISVLPPTQRPSANAIAGFPSAAARPRCRYFVAISSSENGSTASGSIHGPSSTTVTSRPPAARVEAVAAPPAPPSRSPAPRCRSRRRSSSPCHPGRQLVLGEHDQRLDEPYVLANGVEPACLPAFHSCVHRAAVVAPESVLEPGPRAEDERLGGDAGPEVIRHRLQRLVDVTLHDGPPFVVELRAHEARDDLPLEPEHERKAYRR